MSESSSVGLIDDLRVLDLTATRGAYAARLFGDLGASVVRVEHSGSPRDASDSRDPVAVRHLFNNLSKTVLTLDLGDSSALHELDRLIGSSDVVITDCSPQELERHGLDDLSVRFPQVIHLSISPWGLTGPYRDRPASDLTLLAAGGFLSLAGDPDGPPIRPYPEQSSLAASLHGAVGALIALHARDHATDKSARGQIVDVSTHEAVAHSLENAAQYVDLEGVVRTRTGSRPAEAGSGMFRCSDGYVYLVAGLGGLPLAWSGLIDWLVEEGCHDIADELRGDRWRDQAWRKTMPAVDEFQRLFESFAHQHTKEQLCRRGQHHGVSISPVSTPDDLLGNEQLVDRGFFCEVDVAGEPVTVPSAPYRFADAQVGPRSPRGW